MDNPQSTGIDREVSYYHTSLQETEASINPTFDRYLQCRFANCRVQLDRACDSAVMFIAEFSVDLHIEGWLPPSIVERRKTESDF